MMGHLIAGLVPRIAQGAYFRAWSFQEHLDTALREDIQRILLPPPAFMPMRMPSMPSYHDNTTHFRTNKIAAYSSSRLTLDGATQQ